MGTTNSRTDLGDLVPPLMRLRTALSVFATLNHPGTRQTGHYELSELTPAEISLEQQWRGELAPVLEDLYWWPLRNGLDEAPEDEDELNEWLLAAFLAPGATDNLRANVERYSRRSADVGGRLGLELLGVGGSFTLTNEELLDAVRDHAGMLATPDTNISLVDTTRQELAAGIPRAREDDGNTLEVLAAIIGGRVAVRTVAIAATELSRWVAQGLDWVYGGNEVSAERFLTRADDRVCPLCLPFHGQLVQVGSVPAAMQIPIHPYCRCYFHPVTDAWEQPEAIWRGE